MVHGPTCFNEEDQLYRERAQLVRFFKAAYNDTDLGKDFITGCPRLNARRSRLMHYLTGSDSCTYVDFDARIKAYDACVEEVVNRRSALIGRLAGVGSRSVILQLLPGVECEADKAVLEGCGPIKTDCYGPEEKKEFMEV